MSILRQAVLRTRPFPILHLLCYSKSWNPSRWSSISEVTTVLPHRTYASKARQTSTATLVPGSKQAITDETAREEYAKAEEKMQAATEWYRKDCAAVETRASGRITPTLLDPVRVVLPDSNKELRLEEVATVGVREASTLLITVFEEAVSILLVKRVFSSVP